MPRHNGNASFNAAFSNIRGNCVKVAEDAFVQAEVAVDNAYHAVCEERRITGRVHPLTDASWQNAVGNLNRARRALQRATVHDTRY